MIFIVTYSYIWCIPMLCDFYDWDLRARTRPWVKWTFTFSSKYSGSVKGSYGLFFILLLLLLFLQTSRLWRVRIWISPAAAAIDPRQRPWPWGQCIAIFFLSRRSNTQALSVLTLLPWYCWVAFLAILKKYV